MSGGNAVSAALRQPAPEPVADHLFELPTLRPVRLPRSLPRSLPPLALLPRRFSQRARPLRRGDAPRRRKAGAAQQNHANGAERLTRSGC